MRRKPEHNRRAADQPAFVLADNQGSRQSDGWLQSLTKKLRRSTDERKG